MTKQKNDAAHIKTERELQKLERRIMREYGRVTLEMKQDVEEAWRDIERKERVLQVKVDEGLMAEQDLIEWRRRQLLGVKRMETLYDRTAERWTNAKEVAVAYTNDITPGIYSLNRNYAAYEIELLADGIDFILWDERTVKRLIVDDPKMMPHYPEELAVQRGIDLEYGRKQIRATVLSSILRGQSLPETVGELLHRIPTMSYTSAARAARTAVTGAQNAGRIDGYEAAVDMGIELKQEWIATLDQHTRTSHQHLDGERVEVGAKFSNGCEFPGDPKGKPEEIYNCRCTIAAWLPEMEDEKHSRRARNEKGKNDVIDGNITFDQWIANKRG